LIVSFFAEGGLQAPEVKGNRYFAFDSHPRGTVEISWEQYLAVLENGQRLTFVIAGLFLIGSAVAMLTVGELRRTDAHA
jgi:hypothetical protein